MGSKGAETFRAHLCQAGIARPELYERSATRQPIRLHDLRATIITVALATGRTEVWVQDLTGHTTSIMLNQYRRQARQTPLDSALSASAKTLIPEQSHAVAPPGLEPGCRQRRGILKAA